MSTANRELPARLALALVAAIAALALTGALLGLSSSRAEGAAVQPKGGFYKGLTAQGSRCSLGGDLRCLVTFRVRDGIASNGTLEIRYPYCSAKFWVYDSDSVSGSGRFVLSASSASIRGHFVTPTKVTGTVYGSSSCGGGKTVSFVARRQ